MLQDPEYENRRRKAGVPWRGGRHHESGQERGILFIVEGLHAVLLPVSAYRDREERQTTQFKISHGAWLVPPQNIYFKIYILVLKY